MVETTPPHAPAPLQRARGRVEVEVFARAGKVQLQRLFQQGSAKALMPRTHRPTPEVVLVNTAGGLTGGDRFTYGIGVGPDATLTATTQAAERIYRALGQEAEVETRLNLAPGAEAHWLPQETILFDGSRLRRSLRIEMAEDARLLALEALVLGRMAMGERLVQGYLNDQWRLRRGGRLVYADALRVEGDLARAFGPQATLAGARALATLVYAAPDAEARRDPARGLLEALADIEAAASAWNGLLVVRMIAPHNVPLREALVRFLVGFRGGPLPRVWSL